MNINKEPVAGLNNAGRDFAHKRYATVVMDPPWANQQRGKTGLGAERHYDLMTTERIAGLPIPDLLEEDAHVWIWCFVASRMDAQRVAEDAWGLTFRSELIWDKRKTGLGQYLRNSHEHLLLFTRGKAPVLYRGQRTVADWPVQDHSHKPEEAMHGHDPARQSRPVPRAVRETPVPRLRSLGQRGAWRLRRPHPRLRGAGVLGACLRPEAW